MIKRFFEKLFLSFDNDDTTGFDYKKLTAFWGVLASSGLLIAYCVKDIDLYWIGCAVTVKEELPEFKWILGMVFVFILVLTYFTNSKSLTEFIEKIKNNIYAGKNNSGPDTGP